MINELERIARNLNGEKPPEVAVQIRAKTATPDRIAGAVRSIMQVIASRSREKWPSDEEWEHLLPTDFVSYTKSHVDETIRKDPRLCHWEAWLDALRFRSWEWWSSETADDYLIINVQANAWPYNIGPLIYLLFSQGATEVTAAD